MQLFDWAFIFVVLQILDTIKAAFLGQWYNMVFVTRSVHNPAWGISDRVMGVANYICNVAAVLIRSHLICTRASLPHAHALAPEHFQVAAVQGNTTFSFVNMPAKGQVLGQTSRVCASEFRWDCCRYAPCAVTHHDMNHFNMSSETVESSERYQNFIYVGDFCFDAGNCCLFSLNPGWRFI